MGETVKPDKSSAAITSLQNKESIEKALHPLSVETMEKVQRRKKIILGLLILMISGGMSFDLVQKNNYTGIKEAVKTTKSLIFVVTILRA